jgi:hypothetical protein
MKSEYSPSSQDAQNLCHFVLGRKILPGEDSLQIQAIGLAITDDQEYISLHRDQLQKIIDTNASEIILYNDGTREMLQRDIVPALKSRLNNV